MKKRTRTDWPVFDPKMKGSYTILFPEMAPVHFRLLKEALSQEGYKCEALSNVGPSVVKRGLEYVHNDACYPAILVIGQFIDALKSGKYDLDRTALLITQTGGGCRASNYVYLLRKALERAGMGHVPVASLNFSGLDNGGFPVSVRFIRRALSSIAYGDFITSLYNQTKPYEAFTGLSDAKAEYWEDYIANQYLLGKGHTLRSMKQIMRMIAKDFAKIELFHTDKVKVGIVGEIYVKHSPMANNGLEKFLIDSGCEVSVPWLLGFIQYCVANTPIQSGLYGVKRFKSAIYNVLLSYLNKIEASMITSLKASGFEAPLGFNAVKSYASEFIGLGTVMGEGWLLTGEMAELIRSGYTSIICAQPFGCLPNHVVGKAMISKIAAALPQSNIMPIDFDPSQSLVNQENRIKLMIASARRGKKQAFPMRAEENVPAL